MDIEYSIGIDQIDAQRLEEREVAKAVIEAVESMEEMAFDALRRGPPLTTAALSRRRRRMRHAHRQIPRASRNASACIGQLQTVERPKAAALSPRGGSGEESPTKHSSFLPHILGHDKKLAEFIAAKMPAFGR